MKTQGKYPCVGVTQIGGVAVYKDTYIVERLSELNGYVMQKTSRGKHASPSSFSTGTRTQRAPKWETLKETLRLFQEGMTPEEIAQERSLGISTIQTHISTLYSSGGIKLIQVIKMVDVATLKLIKKYISSQDYLSEPGLRKIKDHVESQKMQTSYMEIKLSLAMIEKWDL